MGNIQIKDVPEPLHDELRRRAQDRATTIRDYVLELIERDARLPTRAEWLAELDGLAPVGGDIDAARLVREVRAEREDHLARVVDAGRARP